jgi:hypothetical protein
MSTAREAIVRAGFASEKGLTPAACKTIISRSELSRLYTKSVAIKTAKGIIWTIKLGIWSMLKCRNIFTDTPRFIICSTARTAIKSHITPVMTDPTTKVTIISCRVIYLFIWFKLWLLHGSL